MRKWALASESAGRIASMLSLAKTEHGIPVDSYIAQRREEEAAEATIDRELELLRRAYTLEKEEERPLVAWVPKVPRLVKGEENAKEGFVERAQLEKLLPELPTQVLRDVALWAYGTGMRLGGIRALTWSDYDRQTRTIRLPHRSSKTNRIVTLPLSGSPELATVIERRLSDRRLDSELIFHNGRVKKVGEFYRRGRGRLSVRSSPTSRSTISAERPCETWSWLESRKGWRWTFRAIRRGRSSIATRSCESRILPTR